MKQDRQRLHDLKQPLNVIRLAIGNLTNRLASQDGLSDKAYYKSKLEVVEAQVEKLSVMLEEILEQ